VHLSTAELSQIGQSKKENKPATKAQDRKVSKKLRNDDDANDVIVQNGWDAN